MKPIYKRFLLIFLLFLITTMIGGYLLYQSYTALNEEVVRRTSLLLGKAVEDALQNAADKNLEQLNAREKKRLRALMNSMTSETGSIIHILLINKNMKILLSSDRSIEGQQYKSPDELRKLKSRQPRVLHAVWGNGVKVLDVIIPLKNSGGDVFGYLRLVLSHQELLYFYKNMWFLFSPMVLLFGLLIILSFYLASKTYRQPLESVRALAHRLDEGDYSFRIDYSGKDEYTDTFYKLNKTIEKVGILNESYKKARKRIATMLKAIDESVVMLDSNGNVQIFNDAALRLFKCPPQSDFEDYFRKIQAENPEFNRFIALALKRQNEELSKDLTVWLPDGQDLFVRAQCQVLTEEQRVSGVLLLFKDVRMLEELQNNLQRSMKFSVIANLASSISHEIKNPLSAMAIHAEILNSSLSRPETANSDRIAKSLAVLQNEIKRLNRIIHQFFTLARANQPNLTLLNINAVMKDVLLLVQQQTVERNIQLDVELAPHLDFIYGDADQIKQVVLNLLLNAFQAIERDGRVIVRTKQQNNRILVEIQDNGRGMIPEVQQHIFDLYYSTKPDGSGIGLAISKKIMDAHDGRISFESVPGQGTRFVLDFPRKEASTQTNIPTLAKG
ncbi:MAG TPA: PAS domain-containing protein [Caldithrix abyssi]|uniref:histidine kinase n=1 Tax=Caldithrix abyssi TaxID=187145 RepID=A0A7V5PPL2_CALAY|nr:PAS domain-containing protein [Caldithrix abyssi]